jgi:hypothetical protein
VSAIALLFLVLLCTPVQLDCSLAALQADLLFTPVNTCSVYSLAALQADFEDPLLGPPTRILTMFGESPFVDCMDKVDRAFALGLGA